MKEKRRWYRGDGLLVLRFSQFLPTVPVKAGSMVCYSCAAGKKIIRIKEPEIVLKEKELRNQRPEKCVFASMRCMPIALPISGPGESHADGEWGKITAVRAAIRTRRSRT